MLVNKWSGRRGSNPRPEPWQGSALPTALRPQCRAKSIAPALLRAKKQTLRDNLGLMSENPEPQFWMGGRHASELIEVTNNPSKLSDGDFWAVTANFDGQFTAAKFKSINTNLKFDYPWQPITSTWKSSFDQVQYCDYVREIQSQIADGNVYQVNACRILSADCKQSLIGLASKLISDNPAKFGGYLKLPGIEIASASPERFISRINQTIMTSPIKGTRALGEIGEFSEKDKSENIMIVDLMRNDLGKICDENTISVPRLLANEIHPGLEHLVSDVIGDLKFGTDWPEIIDALLPPGSVSGAPKSSALSIIDKHEGEARGPYCGIFGWVHGGRAELAVAIRIFWKTGDEINFGTGAGITWASDPTAEWNETELKARKLIAIAGGFK